MSLYLVEKIRYEGREGALQISFLKHDLEFALEQEDWVKVRCLDQACRIVVDKVIKANKDDSDAIVLVLNDLKDVYARLVVACQYKVAVMAH